jgi:hypothetical protein
MARQSIDIGVQGNDGTGDSIREAFRKVNENFRDLYAVFGTGDLIKSTNLDDFPSTYDANQVFIVNDLGDAVLAKTLVGEDGVTIDNSDPDELIIRAAGAKLEGDTSPSMSAPLNANTLPIGNVGDPTDINVAFFNTVHGTTITTDDIVISKGYADRRYLKQPGAGGTTDGQIRIRPEPADQSEYTIEIESYENGNIFITSHGFDGGSDGIAFKYYSTGAVPVGLTSGTTYYLKFVDENELSIHPTFTDAKDGINKISIPNGAGTGTQTIVDAYLDTNLPGNFLSNEAIPRESAVRRQGDVLEGPIYLSDHPFPLNVNAVPVIPGADEDFQAATKFYVDNNSFASNINLFVSTSGDDSQAGVPSGKEGRAFAYAYSTVGAACAKAVELIDLANNEPGPYRQKIAYTVGSTTEFSQVQTTGVSGGTGYVAVETLLNLNKDYIRAEVIGYINDTYPNLDYNDELCSRDIGLIIDAVIIDALVEGNWQSINAGRAYFKNASARLASGAQQLETVAGIVYAKSLVNYVLLKQNPPTSYQSVYSRQEDPISTNLTQRDAVADSFDIITDIIQNGVSAAPTVDYGTGYVSFTVNNGGAGNVDQGNPTNIDIIPGKLVKGIKSGAVGRILAYTSGATEDTIDCQLLTPVNFQLTEEVEFAEANKDLQITVRIESGIYYEDLPIKVPANVSLKGDEFRRTIIRPRNRVSQSQWIQTYFYRDTEFDGLELAPSYYPYAVELLVANREFLRRELIAWISAQVAGNIAPFTTLFTYNSSKCSRDVGYIVDALIQDIKYGGNAGTYDAAALYYNGAVSKIAGQESETAAAIDQLKTIVVDYILTNTSYASLQSVIAQTTTANNGEAAAITKTGTLMTSISDVISGGLTALPSTYTNPLYGYHYLKDPSREYNVGPSYTNAGSYLNAAKLLEINKLFIQTEVIEYVDATYPALTYDSDLCFRDVGYIVDAIVADLKEGGKINIVDAAARYYNGVIPLTQETETIAAINYINTIAQDIILNDAPAVVRGTVSQVINTNLVAETGTGAIITNLISSVAYAFDSNYNPPKNNTDIDMFLVNDAVKIHNITGQGHGGFMCVLDPEGAVGSKSPYVQSCASFSRSVNAQTFAGGMFIDGFSGRLAAKITNTSGLTLTLSGLTFRQPVAPTAFYYNGERYQVDNISSWNAISGIATVDLNPVTPWSSGNLNITLETPGNRSMLGNDYTQVNDLGYGVIAHNTGVTEQVSTFTYYCHTAYLASAGGQIRGVAGSNAQGNYGLKAVGADPTEVPDQVALTNDMTQVAKIYRFGEYSDSVAESDIDLYIKRYSYIPASVSEIEVDHLNGTISRYELRSVLRTGITQSNYTYNITNVTNATTAVVTVNGTLPLTVTGITRASPAVVTVTGSHGMDDGTFVTITGVVGMVEINNGSYYIKSTGASTFELYTDDTLIPEVDSTTWTTWASGGTVESPIKFYSGDRIYITGVGGTTELNGNKYYANVLTSNTFELFSDSALTTPVNSTGYGVFTTGGSVAEQFTYAINAITKANPAQVTFTESHHYNDGDLIDITGVTGMVEVGDLYYVKANGANTVQLYSDPTLVTPIDSTTFTTYISGGTASGGQEVLQLTVNTSSNDNRESNGLTTQLSDHMNIAIRGLQNFRFGSVANVNPTRPSTALEFDDTLPDVYRVIAYGTTLADGSPLGEFEAMLSADTSFSYIKPTTAHTVLSTVDPDDIAKTMGATVGDTKIAILGFDGISNIAIRELLNSGLLVLAWNGKTHRITEYVAAVGLIPAYITIEDIVNNNNYIGAVAGLSKALSTTAVTTLRAGLQAGSTAAITVKISTCRVTGHDFLDIGTGGYNTTNYPTAIFGDPAQSASQENEVIEEEKGRVFYVSTDQDGIFRVGRFFTVDQGTGTVTFSASIALSNLDGIGFKRGVTVAEFSTDATMTNNAPDIVPVQSAIRGYIDKRLGIDHSGDTLSVPSLIGPGYMALSGALAMKGELNAGGYKVQNVGAPASNDDASTKLYVDTQVGLYNKLASLTDIKVITPDAGHFLAFTGAENTAVSASATGDIVSSFTSVDTAILVGGITTTPTVDSGIAGTGSINVSGGIVVDDITGFPSSGYIKIGTEIFSYTGITAPSNRFDGIVRALLTTTGSIHAAGSTVIGLNNAQVDLQIAALSIVNADVSESAAIAQSKLALSNATANTTSGTSTKGIASFDSAYFDVTDGWVGIKDNGVTLDKIASITSGNILANFTGSAAAPEEVTAATAGNKILDAVFVTNGVLTKTGTETFAAVPISTTGGNDSLVKTSSTGTINVKGLQLNSNTVLSYSSTTLKVSTLGGVDIISAVGSDPASTPVTVLGQWTLGASATLAATFADLAEYYSSDREYEPGTVLIFGGTAETTTTTIFGDTRLAGVVSTDPGLKMNEGLTGTRICLALQGRVPVKVVGKVKKGDMLTTAGVVGHAAKAIDPRIGTIIGKALEDKDYTEAGVIEVAVGRV